MNPEVVTTGEAFAATAADAPASSRVPVEVPVTVSDPFLAYRRSRGDDPGVYLATTGGQRGWGYFGVDPETTHEVGPDGSALSELDALLAGESLRRGDCRVSSPCWLSYDVARELEDLPDSTRRDRALPCLRLARYHSLAVARDDRLSSLTEDDAEVVMAIRHASRPHVGVRFYPEPILTHERMNTLKNSPRRYPVTAVGDAGDSPEERTDE